MTDFDKMAQAAKAASDARIAEEAEARHKAEEEQARRIEAQEGELESKVVPTLEEASAAFKRQGIDATIKRSWELVHTSRPTVSFVCEGPRIARRYGGHEVPRGAQIDVHHESGRLVVKLEKRRSDGVERFGGALSDALRVALEYALTSYLESVEQIKARD